MISNEKIFAVLRAPRVSEKTVRLHVGEGTTVREKLAGEFSALDKKFNELTVKLSKQDGGTGARPEATGNEGTVLADC